MTPLSRRGSSRSAAELAIIRSALLRPVGRYDSLRAAQIAGVPRRTLLDWAEKGIYVPDAVDDMRWSYRDLVFVRLLAWLRQKRMPVDAASRKVGVAKHRLEDPSVQFTAVRSQGAELLAGDELEDPESGELVIASVAAVFSSRELVLDFDATAAGQSRRWWPDLVQPAVSVSIRPEVMGGEPCLTGSRISTASLFALHDKRGLAPANIARLYPGHSSLEIRRALRLEERLQAA